MYIAIFATGEVNHCIDNATLKIMSIVEHDSDDNHDDELLTVVCHYVAKMSKGATSAMHSGWS